MSCFTKKEVKNPKFPVLSSEVHRLKESEGGVSAVCDVMQKYEKIAREEERQEIIMSALQNKMPKEDMKKYLKVKDEEIVEAERLLMQNLE